MRSWTMAVAVSILASAAAGCGTPCETPAPLSCCMGGCTGDAGTPAICGPGGWTCPAGAVAPGDCLSTPEFCSGVGGAPGGG